MYYWLERIFKHQSFTNQMKGRGNFPLETCCGETRRRQQADPFRRVLEGRMEKSKVEKGEKHSKQFY